MSEWVSVGRGSDLVCAGGRGRGAARRLPAGLQPLLRLLVPPRRPPPPPHGLLGLLLAGVGVVWRDGRREREREGRAERGTGSTPTLTNREHCHMTRQKIELFGVQIYIGYYTGSQ